MAKTIVTQFGEFLNYDNLVKIGIVTNWEDAEINEEDGTISPDYEMIGTDTSGNRIPMGIYKTPNEAETESFPVYTRLPITICLSARRTARVRSTAIIRPFIIFFQVIPFVTTP